MKKIFIALFLISSIPLFGQNHVIGLKGGINLTNVNSSIFKDNNDNRTGFNCGLTYEYRLKNNIYIGIDLLYFQKGFTDDMIFTDDTGNPTGEKATFIYNYDYLSVPIKGGFLIGDKISGFVNLGVVPSILINAKTVEPAIEGITNENTIDLTDQVTKFDFGGLIEIGGSYQFKERFEIFSSFAYLQSFTTITNSDYFSGHKIKHYGMTMSIGLKYILNKE
jgi:hypothetical protein